MQIVQPTDPYDLDRFVAAQDHGNTFEQALAQLRRGRKTSHWMWFVFPQIAGLGHSAMSRRFAVSSLVEARAYLAHPVLGPRLRAAAAVVADNAASSANAIFGSVDAQKLQSSMTLFARVDPEVTVFARVLEQHFGGASDVATDERI